MIDDKLYSKKWTRWIVLFLRLAVGSVFVFSGFVKAIDPWGVLYKFQDYVAALGWDWLSPFLLFGAFAVSIFEFVLGVCLIIGAYRRFSVWASFLLMIVMTPLTLWLSITGAVSDCGCFGEAITLSNTATFIKNVVLLIAVTYLLRYNVRVMNIYSSSIQWIVTLLTIAYVTAIALYGYFYQPMIDFRPYKVGTSVMPAVTDEHTEADFTFIYEKDGVQKEFSIDDIPEEDTSWVFVERKESLSGNAEMMINSSGLLITEDGEEVSNDVIRTEGEQIILVFSDMEDIDISYTYLINMIDDFARQQDADIIGLAAASQESVDEWNDLSMATYPIYTAEDTELKILARGNPAVVYMNDGKIVWKRTLQSISAARVDKAINGEGGFSWVAEDYDGGTRLNFMTLSYLAVMIMILIANRSYRVYKFSARLIKKNQK